jgi:hypothetical protein
MLTVMLKGTGMGVWLTVGLMVNEGLGVGVSDGVGLGELDGVAVEVCVADFVEL